MDELTSKEVKMVNDKIKHKLEYLQSHIPTSSNKEYKLYRHLTKIIDDLNNENYEKVFDIEKVHEKFN